VDTIVKTTSMPRSSAMLSAIEQPNSASGSALARVRFQTVTLVPALARRAAMAAPMRPAPIQPTDPIGVETGLSLMCAPRWCAARSGKDDPGPLRPGARRASRRCRGGATVRRSAQPWLPSSSISNSTSPPAASRSRSACRHGISRSLRPKTISSGAVIAGRPPRETACRRLARLVVVGGAGADLERLPGELGELVPAVAEVERARPAPRRRLTRSPSAAATRGA
jgi:hypothetical protein